MQLCFRKKIGEGCHYSLDWTTGLDYWTGLLERKSTARNGSNCACAQGTSLRARCLFSSNMACKVSFVSSLPGSLFLNLLCSISMSRHVNFTACNSKNLSRNLPVQLFISISCSIVSEKLANRGIVWLSNGKGGGLPGNTEAPLSTRL